MRKPSLRNVVLFVLMAASLVAGALFYLRPTPYLPRNQAELDAIRGQRPPQAGLPPFRIWQQEKEYWKTRTGIDEDMTESCGESVEDGLVYTSSGFFSSTDIVSVIGDKKREARYDTPMFMAYSPRPGKFSRPEDEGVFNPAADRVKVDREVTKLPVWRQKWLAWHIRLSGILELPYSIPDEPILDGGGMGLQICHEGFVYRYQRTYGVQQIEPAIRRLLEIIEVE